MSVSALRSSTPCLISSTRAIRCITEIWEACPANVAFSGNTNSRFDLLHSRLRVLRAVFVGEAPIIRKGSRWQLPRLTIGREIEHRGFHVGARQIEIGQRIELLVPK